MCWARHYTKPTSNRYRSAEYCKANRRLVNCNGYICESFDLTRLYLQVWNFNKYFWMYRIDLPHHPATSSVSLVVSVPLSSGVNLPTNSTAPISSHHQISNIKQFGNSDLSSVNIVFEEKTNYFMVWFVLFYDFVFVFVFVLIVCVRVRVTSESALKPISQSTEYHCTTAGRFASERYIIAQWQANTCARRCNCSKSIAVTGNCKAGTDRGKSQRQSTFTTQQYIRIEHCQSSIEYGNSWSQIER